MDMDELKTKWRATIEGDGGNCPCCGRWGKISAFSITETHALGLLWMSQQDAEDGWIDVPPHAPAWLLRGKNFSLMAKWGLIESAINADEAKRGSGVWRVTPRGHAFILGIVTIPKKAFIYDNTVQGWSDEMVSFKDCFGRHFDYAEVMSDNFNMNTIQI